MKKLILLLFGITICSQAQNTNIRKSLDIFFEGLNQRDTLKVKSICIPIFTIQSVEENGIVSNLVKTPISKFFEAIGSIPKTATIEEKILSYTYSIDGTMAIAWMPYEFYFNDKLSHSGVNVFTMFKDEGTWKVVSIIDTRRKNLARK